MNEILRDEPLAVFRYHAWVRATAAVLIFLVGVCVGGVAFEGTACPTARSHRLELADARGCEVGYCDGTLTHAQLWDNSAQIIASNDGCYWKQTWPDQVWHRVNCEVYGDD